VKDDIYLKTPYFAMAYNHDPSCMETYAKLGISEIWAGVYMPGKSNFGSGRFQKTSFDKIIDYDNLGKDFEKAKSLGLNLSFLLNPACSGNVEFTKQGMKEIKLIASFLKDYKVDYITLGQPFLAKAFKKLSPDTKIKLSSHYNCNSIGKFKFLLDDLDIDIVIVSQFANKNFRLLKKITQTWNPERFEIMCTVPCIMGCPIRNWHAQFYGHSTLLEDEDYIPPYVPCLSETHHNKNIAVSAMFVRREDIKYYQRIGINKFKIGERRDPTESNIKCAEYYTNEISDYIPFFRKSKVLNKINLKAMDGFYDYFFDEKCDGTKYNCHDCNHCDEYAEKVFTHTKKDIEELGIPETKEYFNNILLKKWLDKFDEI
jgi:collagenase-like PrtC family protease